MKKFLAVGAVLTFSVFMFTGNVLAAVDSDNDRVSDDDERNVYYTNPNNPDTDGDGFDDYTEIKSRYSPHQTGKKMSETDFDNDGLNDLLERLLGTDLGNSDSDGDGFKDGAEVFSGNDPRNSVKKARLPGKRIQIGTKEQRLRISVGKVILGEYPISSGVPKFPTPLGDYKIDQKSPRAWSARWKLWMPWWLSLRHGAFGVHELPEWPSGKKEGGRSLGHPASHGCVRLGVGPAKVVYDWADIGTPVRVQKTLH